MARRSSAQKATAYNEKQQRLKEVIHGAEDAKSPEPMERIIHERIRLAIVSALAVNKAMTFNELKKLLGTSDGNLSVHARKLEEAEYIICEKSFEGRMPKTEFKLTPKGRKALERYLNHMEALINAVRKG
jgi:DNA-binding MarR family transcriptional regulator